jgi:PTH1 family peptidyl-tRNA hydrolase
MTALITGLGNPGNKYAGTRHNIGFELIDRLAIRLSISLSAGKGPFYEGKARHGSHQLALIKPATYMNNSGDAVQKALHWFKMQPDECLVCYDDMNIEIGSLRIRPGGSAGGHNGIKDIIQKLGTDRFPRLRIGVGDDFRDGQQVQYVLSPFGKKERKIIDITLEKAADAVLAFAENGIDTAMNTYN